MTGPRPTTPGKTPSAPNGPSLPLPAFAGGTRAITTTPVVGTPGRPYAEAFVPGEEPLEDGELRVTVLGSGNPWVTRGQAAGSILVEVGNPERDLLVFDLGGGSLANFASLKLPVNKLDTVFLTHLHADTRATCSRFAPVAAHPRRAPRGLHARRPEASRLVGRGAHPGRLIPGIALTRRQRGTPPWK